ncbi:MULTISPECIES: YheC/YheD family protein [Paenibacillus]|uniref:YheC/YheD family endospore coat-associated protein n=1 Tax=Paenibacillus TaxID=44249 RepID=UPI0013ECBE4C|nr:MULTISPECIES: YheC/YheD family protein [Paenibacillus]KAF6581315.1 YheC/YheD family protein [Paenibacillus sp. EKM212P]WDZ55684.1 YheC/YheD family protein [Paenibacillus polymyxa]
MPKPVLGIMTLYLNNKKQLEERDIYERMIAEGKRLGLDMYVFTPADVHKDRRLLLAQIYDPHSGKWSRKWREFPDMIFDRCRVQRSERYRQLKQFRLQYTDLVYLNRPLSNKWVIHQQLARRSAFRPHLPATELFNGFHSVKRMLKQNSLVYLKPINGTGGRGILRIEPVNKQGGLYLIEGRNRKRHIIPQQRVRLDRLEPRLSSWNMDNYIVQEGIPVQLPNGRVHDYRMLVQKNSQGVWELTGCAGRIGAHRSVTSNLHGGGKAVPMNQLLTQWIRDEGRREKIIKQGEKLGLDIAAYLEESYGALCELALDLAINKDGHIYVLEVNPKPAREVFSRIGEKDTYRRSIAKPMEYALWVYHTQINPKPQTDYKTEDKTEDKAESKTENKTKEGSA